VALILTSPDGRTVLEEYVAKVKPEFIERAHWKALQVNGYTPEEWTDETCTPLAVVAQKIVDMAKNATLVAQNVSFDESFLTALLAKAGLKPTWHYHKVCTMVLAWPLYAMNKITGTSLVSLCEYFGIPPEPTVHRALNGARTCRSVYLAEIEHYMRSAA